MIERSRLAFIQIVYLKYKTHYVMLGRISYQRVFDSGAIDLEILQLAHTSHYWLYFLLVAGIILLPGMDMAFVMASSLVGGRKSGAAAVAGIVMGGVIHVLMSGLGVGLLLVSAPGLFNVLLIVGSLYVAWMGVSFIRGATTLGQMQGDVAHTNASTFYRALVTCLLNPKAYVFMLAVFPQFLRAERGSIVMQSVVLCSITALTQIAVYGGVVLGAARLQQWVIANNRAQIWLGRSVGALLVALAFWTISDGLHR